MSPPSEIPKDEAYTHHFSLKRGTSQKNHFKVRKCSVPVLRAWYLSMYMHALRVLYAKIAYVYVLVPLACTKYHV